MNRTRVAAALTASMMVCALLSACLFLSAYAEHDCRGESCPFCLMLQECVEQFRTARTAGGLSVIAATAPVFRREPLRVRVPAQSSRTLVTWKVKLSN